VAHELAHQWFGDSVSVADWSDIWLNEGFADYSEGLWIEHTRGSEAMDEWVKSQYAEVLQYPQFYPPPGNPAGDDLFNGGVYVRGGLTLHAVRLEVGDEVFFKILQTYFERYKSGNATTEDFLVVVNEVSGKDLTNLLDSWLYSEKLPSIPALGLGVEQ
jgi:aminopeptidase N